MYNDVLAAFAAPAGELHCAEIRNIELTSMQIQIFDFFWSQANRFRILNDEGADELVRRRRRS